MFGIKIPGRGKGDTTKSSSSTQKKKKTEPEIKIKCYNIPEKIQDVKFYGSDIKIAQKKAGQQTNGVLTQIDFGKYTRLQLEKKPRCESRRSWGVKKYYQWKENPTSPSPQLLKSTTTSRAPRSQAVTTPATASGPDAPQPSQATSPTVQPLQPSRAATSRAATSRAATSRAATSRAQILTPLTKKVQNEKEQISKKNTFIKDLKCHYEDIVEFSSSSQYDLRKVPYLSYKKLQFGKKPRCETNLYGAGPHYEIFPSKSSSSSSSSPPVSITKSLRSSISERLEKNPYWELAFYRLFSTLSSFEDLKNPEKFFQETSKEKNRSLPSTEHFFRKAKIETLKSVREFVPHTPPALLRAALKLGLTVVSPENQITEQSIPKDPTVYFLAGISSFIEKQGNKQKKQKSGTGSQNSNLSTNEETKIEIALYFVNAILIDAYSVLISSNDQNKNNFCSKQLSEQNILQNLQFESNLKNVIEQRLKHLNTVSQKYRTILEKTLTHKKVGEGKESSVISFLKRFTIKKEDGDSLFNTERLLNWAQKAIEFLRIKKMLPSSDIKCSDDVSVSQFVSTKTLPKWLQNTLWKPVVQTFTSTRYEKRRYRPFFLSELKNFRGQPMFNLCDKHTFVDDIKTWGKLVATPLSNQQKFSAFDTEYLVFCIALQQIMKTR